jgi:hypothetical protein
MFPPIDCVQDSDDPEQILYGFSLLAAHLNITERPMIPVQPRQTGGTLPSGVP